MEKVVDTPISRKEYLDDPKHPLRLKPSIKRKPKQIDKVKQHVEKSNENFSLIEKMREEIESIVGPVSLHSFVRFVFFFFFNFIFNMFSSYI